MMIELADSATHKGTGKEMEMPAIALIGCGAIAESFYLPAITRNENLKSKCVLIDLDSDRAREVAARFGIAQNATDFRSVINAVDGVIVATPPRTHFPITLECIRAGVPALCEKPLAESAAQAIQLAEEAEKAGVAVAVNHTRRLFPAAREIRSWILEGKLGRLCSIDFRHGEKFDWPSVGDTYFGVAGGGRGVLSDVGAHVVDLVCWWIGGKPRLTSYQDDSCGGTEAVARLELEHEGCEVNIRLSWLSKLENMYRIHGDAATIEGEMHDFRSFSVIPRAGNRRAVQAGRGPATYSGFAAPLVANFLGLIQGREHPIVGIRDVLPSIGLIEECYSRRTRFDMPWFDPCGETS